MKVVPSIGPLQGIQEGVVMSGPIGSREGLYHLQGQ
jgi:hypothetical protein